MKEMKVNTGSLWIGRDWKEAIKLSLETPDCGVEEVYKYVNPNTLLNNKKVLIGYQIYGYGNHRKYKTRIPKSLNEFIKGLLKEKNEYDRQINK